MCASEDREMPIDFCLKCGTPFRGEAGCPWLCSEDREMPGSVQDHEATVIEALEAMLAWTHVPPVTPLIQVKRDQIETALAHFRRASGLVDPAAMRPQVLIPSPEEVKAGHLQPFYGEVYVQQLRNARDGAEAELARVRAERDEADRQWRFELERFKAAEARCASIRTETVARVRSMPLGYRPQDVADELEAEFSAPVQADTEETAG